MPDKQIRLNYSLIESGLFRVGRSEHWLDLASVYHSLFQAMNRVNYLDELVLSGHVEHEVEKHHKAYRGLVSLLFPFQVRLLH